MIPEAAARVLVCVAVIVAVIVVACLMSDPTIGFTK